MLDNKQKGLSPIGVLFMICVFAFVLLVTLKLAQHYMDFLSVRSVFQTFAADEKTASMSPDKIKEEMYKQLAINNIRDFNLDERAYFANDAGEKVLGFSYEVREHMVGNVDAVVSFQFEEPME